MMNKCKKTLSVFFTLLLCSANFAAVATSSSIATPSHLSTPSDIKVSWPLYSGELNSQAGFVMDADSSKVLYTKNADKKMYPASLTKVMTAIIVLDKVGNNFEDLVTFSYNSVTKDIDKNSVTIGASAGDQLSIKDCLYSLLLPSANDVANALAEHIAGNTHDFALLMNEKAKNLGLTNTNFVNASGLHDDNQYTTASDMAKIIQCAIKYPMFLQISSSVSYKHAPIRKYKNPENSNNQVLNTNSIMVPGSGYYYQGITSGKTGHTELAGYNLACTAKKDNMHLICVTLNAKSEKERFTDAKNLFDFHFDNYKSLSIKEYDDRFAEKIDTISINDIDLVKTLSITCDDTAHITVPKNTDLNLIKSKITYQVKNIYDKYAIGYVTYTLFDDVVGECTLEGRNYEAGEEIYTNYLNLSKSAENTEIKKNAEENVSQSLTTNALIYKNENGNIVISKTLFTMITIFVLFVILVVLWIFIYTKILTNANFSLNKAFFRFRRFFRK